MIRKFFKNVWVQVVLGGALASLLFDLIKKVPVLTSIKWVFELIVSILMFKVALWIIILVILIVVLVIWLIGNVSVNKVLPKFVEEYRQDTFRSWIWKWDWEQNSYSKKWDITNLRPYCQYCNCIMSYNESMLGGFVKCPKCTREYSERDRTGTFEHKGDIGLLIYNKVESQYISEKTV